MIKISYVDFASHVAKTTKCTTTTTIFTKATKHIAIRK
jgi:hypothetical protein